MVPATTAADSQTSAVVLLLMKLDQQDCPKWAHAANRSHWYSLEYKPLYWPQMYSILKKVKKSMTRL